MGKEKIRNSQDLFSFYLGFVFVLVPERERGKGEKEGKKRGKPWVRENP